MKSHSWEIKGYTSYISKLLKGSSLGEGGHTFEESLREGEGAHIPRRSSLLEERATARGTWHASLGEGLACNPRSICNIQQSIQQL